MEKHEYDLTGKKMEKHEHSWSQIEGCLYRCDCGMIKIMHKWQSVESCLERCEVCGKEKGSHKFEEIMLDGLPFSEQKICKKCQLVEENFDMPHRPQTEITELVIEDLVRQMKKKEMAGNSYYLWGERNLYKVWFQYPQELISALSVIMRRAEDQLAYIIDRMEVKL